MAGVLRDGQNMRPMGGSDRPQRADAARNRRRLLEAAAEVFAEHGLEAGVGEIAARAGVGRGTLFRNFPTKEALIAAIVVERMQQGIDEGRRLLAEGDGDVVFSFLEFMIERQREDRALFEAVSEEFLANAEIRAVHSELIALLEDLLERGKEGGTIRPEIGPLDVLMLLKGLFASACALELSPDVVRRHADLIRAAISAPGHAVQLRGRAPTLEDLQAGVTPPGTEARAAGG